MPGTPFPGSNGPTDQVMTHISDALAPRNLSGRTNGSDRIAHRCEIFNPRLASGLHASAAVPPTGAWGRARDALSAARRPPPVWGCLVGRLRAHTPAHTLF